MGEPWPLVGRQEMIRQSARELLDGDARALIITGPAGVGKTSLARAIARSAAQSGLAVLRCVASVSAATMPFGAVATLLPPQAVGGDRLALLGAVRSSLVADHGDRALVWVDDAQLLDDGSATLVHQLVTTGACRALLTVRSGEPVPDAVTALWRGGDAGVVEVGPLDLLEVEEVLSTVLGPPVTRGTAWSLWQRTGGNPLLLRELVTACLADATLARDGGAWTLRAGTATSLVLSDLVRARIGALEEADAHVVELLALAEQLRRTTVRALVPEADLDGLELRGILHASGEAQDRAVRLVHPVYGEVVRTRLPTDRRRRRYGELADALERTGDADPLRLATWLLESDRTAPAALLTQASALARNRFDLDLAARLARAAVAADGGVAALLTLADVLARQGHLDEALTTLDRAAAGAQDDGQVAEVADRMAYVLDLAGRRAEGVEVLRQASARVDAERRALLDSQAAILDVLAGRPAPALDVTQRIVAEQGGRGGLPVLVRLRVDYAQTYALALLGRFAEADALADDASAYLTSLGAGHYPAEMAFLGRIVSRLFAGRLAEADRDARRVEQAALALGDRDAEWTVALYRGRVASELGQVVDALVHFDRAAALTVQMGDATGQRWCRGGRLLALAMLGRSAQAEDCLAEFDAEPAAQDGLFEADLVRRALGWALAATGQPVRAQEAMREAVALSGQLGQASVELSLRHDALRLGDLDQVGPLLELANRMAAPFPRAVAAHATAVRAGDGRALAEAAELFAACGAAVPAAEAAVCAVTALRRAGEPRAATRAERRAAQLRAACSGVVLPTLVTASAGDDLLSTPLSARERQIAELAARRLTAAEIAERLVISRRTVENHLQRIYAKLGVSGRAELARALGRD